MALINDNLLCNFANQFFGYGNYSSSIWLVGMEEGGGNSIEEVGKKVCLWVERGQRELEDLRKYHLALGKTHSTLFVLTNHPASFGASNKYFHDVGRLIAKHL